jgi:hypothetical protein
MKNNMSVWTFPYRTRYYLTHPLKFIGQIKRNVRAAYNRTTKGYCVWDWADLDSWFVTIMPNMLRDMARNGHAYPGSEPFDTPEKWRSWLIRMAEQLEYCQDEDNGNEYAQPYLDELMKNPHHHLFEDKTPAEQELFEKYYNRSIEVMDEHKKLFEDTMKEIIEHWNCLWD